MIKVVTSGTLGSDGLPAPHSWSVLDEVDLFNFFDGQSVDRHPAHFEAQLDLGGPVSWASTTQKHSGSFSYIDGTADVPSASMDVTNVANAADVVLDAGAAGITSSPVRVTATAGAAERFNLRLTGFASSPSYLLDTASGQLITLVDSDPASGSLLVDMAPGSSLDAQVISDPDWTASLTSTPNPVSLGATSTVLLDGSAGAPGAWVIIATNEMLLPIKGVTITANPIPPSILLFLPLDANGNVSFPATIPTDPLLSGLRIPIQALLINAFNQVGSVSNLWGFKIS